MKLNRYHLRDIDAPPPAKKEPTKPTRVLYGKLSMIEEFRVQIEYQPPNKNARIFKHSPKKQEWLDMQKHYASPAADQIGTYQNPVGRDSERLRIKYAVGVPGTKRSVMAMVHEHDDWEMYLVGESGTNSVPFLTSSKGFDEKGWFVEGEEYEPITKPVLKVIDLDKLGKGARGISLRGVVPKHENCRSITSDIIDSVEFSFAAISDK